MVIYFSLKAYVDDGRNGKCRVVLLRNLKFNEAVESINRVFTFRVEVWNQITNRPVVRFVENRSNYNKREQYIPSKVVNQSSENYVPMFKEDKPKKVRYVSYR